jgi:hypothetical protein
MLVSCIATCSSETSADATSYPIRENSSLPSLWGPQLQCWNWGGDTNTGPYTTDVTDASRNTSTCPIRFHDVMFVLQSLDKSLAVCSLGTRCRHVQGLTGSLELVMYKQDYRPRLGRAVSALHYTQLAVAHWVPPRAFHDEWNITEAEIQYWGSHSGHYEGCDAVYSGTALPTFRRESLPPSSESECYARKAKTIWVASVTRDFVAHGILKLVFLVHMKVNDFLEADKECPSAFIARAYIHTTNWKSWLSLCSTRLRFLLKEANFQ